MAIVAIADDTPTLTRVASTVLEGTCPPALSDLLEVRGLGILNIRRMFGDSAIKRNKRVRLILHLVKMEEISPPADARLQECGKTGRFWASAYRRSPCRSHPAAIWRCWWNARCVITSCGWADIAPSRI